MRFGGSNSSISILAWAGLAGLTLSGSTSCIDTGLLWFANYEAKIQLPNELKTSVTRPVGSLVDDLFYGEIHDLNGLPYEGFDGGTLGARFYADANCTTDMWDDDDAVFTTDATGSTFDFNVPGGPSRIESFYVRFFAINSYKVGPSDCSAVLNFVAGPPSAIYAWPLWANDEEDIYNNHDRERFTAVANGIPTMVRARVGDAYGNPADLTGHTLTASLSIVSPAALPGDMTLGSVSYNNGTGYFEAMVDPPALAGTYLLKISLSGDFNFETEPFEFVVTNAPASQLALVPGELLPTRRQGDGIYARIVAKDAYGNIATDYTGKAQISINGSDFGGTHNFASWQRGVTYQYVNLPAVTGSLDVWAYDPNSVVTASAAHTLFASDFDAGCNTGNYAYPVDNQLIGWHLLTNWSNFMVPDPTTYVNFSLGGTFGFFSNGDVNCFLGQYGTLNATGVRMNVNGAFFRTQSGFEFTAPIDISMDDTAYLKTVELSPQTPVGSLYLSLAGNAILRGYNGSSVATPGFDVGILALNGSGKVQVEANQMRVRSAALTVSSGQEFIVGTFSHVHLDEGLVVNGGGVVRILPGGRLTVGAGKEIRINTSGTFIARGAPSYEVAFGGASDSERAKFTAGAYSTIELVYFQADFLDQDGINLLATSTPAPLVGYGAVYNIMSTGTGLKIGPKLLNRQLSNLTFQGYNGETNYTPMHLELTEYVYMREIYTNIDYRYNGDSLTDILGGSGVSRVVPTFQEFYEELENAAP